MNAEVNGLFITIEGADGSGKSTQIDLLNTYLASNNYDVLLTREPGGTVISEVIREIILDKAYMEMCDMTETLLYAAARAQHVQQLIKPALEQNKIVICDRYVDSSLVYQGIGRGLGVEAVSVINRYATGGLEPDLTILLNLQADEGLKRKKEQRDLDRLELQRSNFYKKVGEGFLALSRKESKRIKVVNATKSIEEVHQEILSYVQKYLADH